MRLILPNSEHSEALERLKNSTNVETESPRLIDRIVVDDNELIAYGMIHQFCEGVIVPNYNVSNYRRAKAVDMLMELAAMVTEQRGLEQLHVFTKDPKFAASLEKHYGFERNPDIVLIRKV